MSCHLIQDSIEQCAGCAAHERGEKFLDTSGEPSTPLCPIHFNAMLDKVHPYGE